MGLLEDLRRQAAAKRREERDTRRAAELQAERLRRDIEPRMLALRRYLVELVRQLNYVEPEVRASYQVPGTGCRLSGLRQTGYLVSAYHDGEFALRFRCVGPTSHRVKSDDPVAVRRLQELLRDHGLAWSCKEIIDDRYQLRGATFVIADEVEVRFTFRADPAHDGMLMVQRHFQDIGEQRFIFPAVTLNRGVFDQLGEYLLRRSDAVLEHQMQFITEQEREALKQRLGAELGRER